MNSRIAAKYIFEQNGILFVNQEFTDFSMVCYTKVKAVYRISWSGESAAGILEQWRAFGKIVKPGQTVWTGLPRAE